MDPQRLEITFAEHEYVLLVYSEPGRWGVPDFVRRVDIGAEGADDVGVADDDHAD